LFLLNPDKTGKNHSDRLRLNRRGGSSPLLPSFTSKGKICLRPLGAADKIIQTFKNQKLVNN
jgi:hypothetical protein